MPRADALTTLKRQAEDSGFFRAGDPVIYRTAHGALDVLGGLSAAAGGTMAQMPLPAYVAVAVQFDARPRLRIRSGQMAPPVGEPELELALPAEGRGINGGWGAGIVALAAQLPAGAAGASILIHSDIAQGAGQSSSTALLAAAALGLGEAGQAPSALAIAQRVAAAEAVAQRGAATRIDGGAIIAALTCLHSHVTGKPRVLRYSAQPHRYVGPVPLPEDVRMLALDTGVRHSRAGAGSGNHMEVAEEFAVAAAMGLRIIETVYSDLGQSHTPLQGYLANTSPLLYRQYFRTLLPRRMRFGDFVRTYGPLDFPEADKDRMYRVRTVVDHLIAEHEHAEQFLQAMEELAEGGGGVGDLAERQRTLQRAGRLLLASHHSYRLRLELSCREADWLVDRLMEAGPEQGIYGARITGEGGGGTVAALLARTSQATDALLEVMKAYQRMTGLSLGVTEA